MNTTIISAHNLETGQLVGAEFAAVDAVHEPLRVIQILMEGLASGATGGYWLVDFKGVPVARAQSPYGLLYLDESHHVLQAVEISPDSVFAPFPGTPESALVVLPGAIGRSQTKEGDQLALNLVRRAPAKVVPASAPQGSRVVSIGEGRGFKGSGERAQPAVPSGSLLKSAVPSVTPPAASAVEAEAEAVLAEEPEPATVEEPKPAQSQALTLVEQPPAKVEAATQDTPAAAPPETECAAPAVAGDERATKTAEPVGDVAVSAPTPTPTPQRELAPTARPPQEPPPAATSLPWKVRFLYRMFPELDLTCKPAFDAAQEEYWKRKMASRGKPALYIRVLSWFYPELHLETVEQRRREQRRSPRLANTGLVGYYFSGGESKPHEIRNLSVTGFLMKTEERWLRGTVLRINLQRTTRNEDDPEIALTVHCRVVSECEDGVGFEFVLPGLAV